MPYNKKLMRAALKEAVKAYYIDEVPVGAVVAKDGNIISSAHNLREHLNDMTAHAEILAMKKAAKKIGGWNLEGYELYVTLEPCLMCTATIMEARIKKVYVGAISKEHGYFASRYQLLKERIGNINVDYEFVETVSPYIISRYFRKLRNG